MSWQQYYIEVSSQFHVMWSTLYGTTDLCGDAGFNLFCMNQSSRFSMYFIIEVTHNNHLEGVSIIRPGLWACIYHSYCYIFGVKHKAETAYMLVNIPGCYVCMVNDSYTNTSVCTYIDVNFFHISSYNCMTASATSYQLDSIVLAVVEFLMTDHLMPDHLMPDHLMPIKAKGILIVIQGALQSVVEAGNILKKCLSSCCL